MSTATVERGFSAMNRILSYARNSLTKQLASDFIRLSLTKDILIELDLDAVVDAWVNLQSKCFITLN